METQNNSDSFGAKNKIPPEEGSYIEDTVEAVYAV